MYMIVYKNSQPTDINKIEYNRPLTFYKANEMFLDTFLKYKQTGHAIQISFKIIEMETEATIFNSKILIKGDTFTLFDAIKNNINIPSIVRQYVSKIEVKEILETEDELSLNTLTEEKLALDQLIQEKRKIQDSLKKDEKDRKEREMQFHNKIKAIQEEKLALEKSLQLRQKEDQIKESERSEAIRKLEEEKILALKQMEERRKQDKTKKEEHENRLKEVEDETKKVQIELRSMEMEIENNNLLRKKELQEYEEQKTETDRMATILAAEDEKNDFEHKEKVANLSKNEPALISEAHTISTPVIPKVTFKERFAELDWDTVKSTSIQSLKYISNTSLKVFRRALQTFRDFRDRRVSEKKEKLENANKKLEIEERIATEKINFLKELQAEKEKQERVMKKELKKKQMEMVKQEKIQARYVAEIKKKNNNKNGSKVWIGTLGAILIFIGCIYYFDFASHYPILSNLKSYLEGFIS